MSPKDEQEHHVQPDYQNLDIYHLKRRQEILAKHPEIRDLICLDPSFKFVAAACALTQFYIGYLLSDAYLTSIVFMAASVGAFYCNAITNSLHEIVHDRAIEGSPLANKWFGGFVNLSMCWPIIGGYYTSHRNHHAYLGSDLDTKYPSMQEALEYDQTFWDRIRFLFRHPWQGGERWEKNVKQPPSDFAIWNYRTVWLCNGLILYFFGYKMLLYLLMSTFIDDCIFIQGSKNFLDHWVADNHKAYTRSYYGWINMFNHNIGYHREHHDFPMIPGKYFPELRRIAIEYYSDPDYYEDNLFKPVWEMLTAPPGKGITKHANKLSFREVRHKAPKET